MKKNILKVMLDNKLVESFSEARRLLLSGVVEVNKEKVVSLDKVVKDNEEVRIVNVKK